MAAAITTTLSTVATVNLRGKVAFGLTIANTGGAALNAFEIHGQMTPGGRFKKWDLSWTAPAANYPIQINFDDTVNPEALAPGEVAQFRFDYMDVVIAVQFKASSGTTTLLEIETSEV